MLLLWKEPLNVSASLIGHLRGPGGQDESRQSGQVSRSAEVGGQQSVTHDDVAAQDGGVLLFISVRHQWLHLKTYRKLHWSYMFPLTD